MDYKQKKFILTAVASSLILAGCGGSDSGDQQQIVDNTYQPPSVLNCDNFQATQMLAADEFTAEVTCVLSDTSARDLTASTFMMNIGNRSQSGTAKSYDVDTGIATFELSTFDDVGGEVAELCVTPKSNAGNHNQGTQACFVADSPVADFEAPFVASYQPLSNLVRIDNSVTAVYQVSDDANGEHAREVTSDLEWFLDDIAIEGEVTPTLLIDPTWVGQYLKYCVMPRTLETIGANTEGEVVCADAVEILPAYREETPEASAQVSFGGETIEDGQVNTVPVQTGEVLTATYVFEPGLDNEVGNGETSKEGSSPAYWQRVAAVSKTSSISTFTTNEPEVIKMCDFSDGKTSCDYTIEDSDLSYRVEFCVTPTTENETTGAQVCSGTDVFGIDISGEMEYLKQLTIDVYGYDLIDGANSAKWYVDVNHSVAADELRTLADNSTPTNSELLHAGREFEIAPVQGLRAAFLSKTVWEKAGVSSERRGGISDWSWDKFVSDDDPLGITSLTPDANDFIGKEVRVCLDIKDATSPTCLDMSEQVSVSDALEFTQAGVSSEVFRGIAPVKVLSIAKDDDYEFLHHRPLTLHEGNALTGTTYFSNVNGIEWAQFIQQTYASGSYDPTPAGHQEDALLSCLDLKSDGYDWSVPIFDATMSITPEANKTALNIYAKNTLVKSENGETLSNYDGIASLGFKVKPLTSTDESRLSAATGWPLVSNSDKEQSQTDLDNATKTRTFVAGYGSATLINKGFTVGQSWSSVDKSQDESGGEKYIWNGASSTKGSVPMMSCVTKISL